MTPEGRIKNKVKRVLEKIGCYYFFPATGGYGKSGVPDVIICYNGRFIGIECKANGNTPTALQNYNLEQIRKNNGRALVIDETNVDDLESILKS